jgi:hypothetical protein
MHADKWQGKFRHPLIPSATPAAATAAGWVKGETIDKSRRRSSARLSLPKLAAGTLQVGAAGRTVEVTEALGATESTTSLPSLSHGYSSNDVAEFVQVNWLLNPPMHRVWVENMDLWQGGGLGIEHFVEVSARVLPRMSLCTSAYANQGPRARTSTALQGQTLPSTTPTQ